MMIKEYAGYLDEKAKEKKLAERQDKRDQSKASRTKKATAKKDGK